MRKSRRNTPSSLLLLLLLAVCICPSSLLVIAQALARTTTSTHGSASLLRRATHGSFLVGSSNTSSSHADAATSRRLGKDQVQEVKQDLMATDDSDQERKSQEQQQQQQGHGRQIQGGDPPEDGKGTTSADKVDGKNPAKDTKESLTKSNSDAQEIIKTETSKAVAEDVITSTNQLQVHKPAADATDVDAADASNSNSNNNWTMAVNMTALSLTACEQIEMAVSFITSLDFDQSFMNLSYQIAHELASNNNNNMSSTTKNQQRHRSNAIWDVYLLQMIIVPISLAMGFFGSNLLLPACCLTAIGLGVFLVFHVLQQLSQSSSKYAFIFQMDCQMKLALGLVSACISGMAANFFVRFGLFSLGALASGGASYLILDAFPWLDPTLQNNHDMTLDVATTSASENYNALLHHQHSGTHGGQSELSAFGWIITIIMGIWGGVFLRWYEQASLEVVTAIMGGLGLAYSFHTFVIVQGGNLHRSVVFLIANFVAFFGWRFQRGRRLWKQHTTEYSHKKNYQEQPPQQSAPLPYAYAPVASEPPTCPSPSPLQQQEQQSSALWDPLQSSMYSVKGLLQRSSQLAQYNSNNNETESKPPTAEEILELTKSLQTLLQRMNTSSTDKVEDKTSGKKN